MKIIYLGACALLSWFIPKRKGTYLIDCGYRRGNIEKFSEYCSEIDGNKVLIGNNEDPWKHSPLSTLWRLCRSKYLIIDANSTILGRHSIRILFNIRMIDLWHGTGLKPIKLQSERMGKINLLKELNTGWQRTICASSEYDGLLKSEGYGKYSRIIVQGTPQIDDLISSNQISRNESVILYAPTFLDNSKDNIDAKFIRSLPKIDKILEKYNAFLDIKLHPVMTYNLRQVDLPKRVRLYKENKRTNQTLKNYIALISDNSGVICDYTLLERPIIRLNWSDQHRDSWYSESLLGRISVETEEQLLKMVDDILSNEKARANVVENVKKLRPIFHKFNDNCSCKRIRDIICSDTLDEYQMKEENLLPRVQNKYISTDSHLRNVRAKSLYLAPIPRFIVEPLAYFVIVLVALLSILIGYGSLPALATVIFALSKILPLLQTIFSSYSLFNTYFPSYTKLLDLIDDFSLYQRDYSCRIELPSKELSISLNDVSYSYSTSSPSLLSNVNLDLNIGSYYLFEGPSGQGKSTLFDLILCLLQPTHGHIYINGHDPWVNKQYLNLWHSSLFSVSQNIFLPGTSLHQNLLADLGYTPDDLFFHKVYDCLYLNNICPSTDSLNNFHTGNNARLLSGGQRQRVAIARALLSRKPFLFLDEATNALDPELESSILTNLVTHFRHLTILHISHNPSNRKFANQVFIVNHNKVIKNLSSL